MDLAQYRESDSEKRRTEDLMRLICQEVKVGQSALDIGARDGHFSKLMAEHFDSVIALDLEKPSITHEGILCVRGDVTKLDFDDNTFDLVFCAEVLEHIPTHLLEKACSELSRVSKQFLLIGVPYKQDIRVGRTTCYTCGKKNPPWGHVNRFDRKRLGELFPLFNGDEVSFVGKTDSSTNSLSAALMDLAGNPYGTYSQEEGCIHCGEELTGPPERNFLQKVFTKAAFYAINLQKPFLKAHPDWIHVLFKKAQV